MMALLAGLAAGGPAPRPRAERVRLEGPLRDLAGDLVRIAGTIRSAPPAPAWLVDQARYLDGHLDERGLYPGCHVRGPDDPPLEGDQVAEWFAGQLVQIVEHQHAPALVDWVRRVLGHFGEPPLPVFTVRVTPEDASKLSADDVKRLARAEERRERRGRRRVELQTFEQGTGRRDFDVVHQDQVDVIDADDAGRS